MDRDMNPVGIMTLLLVDDDERTLKHLSWNLSLYAGAVVTAVNGEEGLAAFKEHKPDIVLTDIQMPKMNGIDMAEEIKVISPHTPIVIMTAHEEATYLMKSIEIRADKYLKKPVNVDVLADVIVELSKNLLQRRMIQEKNAIIAAREAELANILNNTREGFISIDADGSINDINRALLIMLHVRREQVFGRSISEVFDEAAAREIMAHITQLSVIGDTVSFETPITIGGHNTRYAIVNANLTEIPGVKRCRVNAFFTDITQRRRTEQALSESERKFRDLFENHDAGMVLIEPETGRIADANRASARVFMQNEADMLDADFTSLLDMDADTFNNHIKDVTTSGSANITATARTPELGERHIEMITNPVDLYGKTYVMSIVRDVSEEILMKERVQQQSRLAMLGQMARSITHHWRQPLTTIGLILQDLGEAYAMGELNEEYIEGSITKGMEKISFMSDKLDDIKRFIISSDGTHPFDIRQAVLDTIALFTHEFERLDIQSSIVIDGVVQDSPEKVSTFDDQWLVLGKSDMLREAIFQVLTNSMDAKADLNANTPETSSNSLTISVSRVGDSISLAIADTFGGFAHNDIERVCQPYYTTRTDSTHFGMGLYIARHVVEHTMKGSFTVSDENNGAKITMTMPHARARSVAAQGAGNESEED